MSIKLLTVFGAVGVVALNLLGAAAARDTPAEQNPVVAVVGDESIRATDVARLLDKAIHGREVDPQGLLVLQAQTLAEIVDRRLVLAYARRMNSGPGRDEIDAGFEQLKAELVSRRRPLNEFLSEQSITEADLRRQIGWNLTWVEYLHRYVTDERLVAYFANHRRQFDGTEISVSHILLENDAAEGPATDDLLQRAEEIREKIVSGELSFGQAARRYSAGPSRENGGQLGFIPRHGVMVDAFSRQAFSLEVGQTSQPVVTSFGVHLIRCEQIKPGGKTLEDVRDQLTEALARELLAKLARLEERHTPVRFTGAMPHFKPGTRELVR